MNESLASTLYILGVVVVIGITLFALRFTWFRLSTRGARSLFMLTFLLFAFSFIFLMSLFTRSQEGMHNIMLLAHAIILMIPFPWTAMVYEMSDRDVSSIWHFMVPWTLINVTGFVFFIFPLDFMGEPLEYSYCLLLGSVNRCQIDHSWFYYLVMGFLLFEILGGNGWLAYYLTQPKQVAQRQKYMRLVISMTIGSIVLFLIGVVVHLPGGLDPLPIGIGILAILLFNAIFNQGLMRIGSIEQKILQPVDDLLLVVDSDHFIQDVNLALLNVFGMDVDDLINVQLEHAFIDSPEIISLFNNTQRSDTFDMPVEGELHTFKPVLEEDVNPLTSVGLGQRLILKDITLEQSEVSTENKQPKITLDPLTDQYDRKTFFNMGERIFTISHRNRQSLAVAVINIDDFSRVNQRFSHLVGDQVLLEIVEIVNSIIRQGDVFARFDSDNLVILLPKADEFSAYQVCARIKEAIAEHTFTFRNQEFQVTVSMGYTTFADSEDFSWTLEGLVEVANKALDQSQTLGRNRLTYLPAMAVAGTMLASQEQ